MAGELVTGYLRLVPTVSGIQGQTAKALAPATREGSLAGGRVGGAFGKSWGISAKKVLGIGAGVIGAFAAKKFLTSSKDAFIELNAEVKGLQRTAGGTIPEVSALRGALQLSGVTVPKATISLKIFSKNLLNASADSKKAAAMQKLLGTSFTDSHGKIDKFTTLLPKVADTFAAMEDGPNKSALALKLFGRSGIDMLPFLNKGASGIKDLEVEAKKLGITLDDGAQNKWKAYREEERKSEAAMQGLKVTIGGAVLPIFTRFSTFLTDNMIPAFASVIDWLKTSDQVKDFTTNVQSGFDNLQSTVDGVKDTLGTLDLSGIDGRKLGESLSTALGVALDDLGGLTDKVFTQIGDVMGKVDWVALGITVGTQALPFVVGLATGIINGISEPSLWAGIWHNLPAILIAVLSVAFAPSKLAGPLERILTRIPFAGKLLAGIVRGLQGVGGKVTGLGADLFRQFWRGLTDGGIPGGAGIGRIASKIFTPLLQLIPRTISFGLRLQKQMLDEGFLAARALGSGLRDGVGGVVRFVGGIPKRFLGAIKGEKTLLHGVGGDIVDGLKQGISDKWHDVTGFLSGKIAGLSKVAKKILHINSPSKVFAEIGHGIGEGMHLGIKTSMPMVERASADLVGSTIPGGGRPKATAFRAPSAAASAVTGHSYDRPVRTESGALVAIIREHAGDEAELVYANHSDFNDRTGRQNP